MKTLKWFENRIGKVIFRDDNFCGCSDCKRITETGLTIHDKDHAYWLYVTQNDYANEAIFLNYRDKK